MSADEVLAVLKRIDGKPRYITDAVRTIMQVARAVTDEYAGDARNLWNGQTATEIKARLISFHGVASGIASMVVNLLASLKEIEFTEKDYRRMDVKPDSQLRRVFERLGFCEAGATERQVVDAARRLHPSYPGALDAPAWHIGRKWCHMTQPDCPGCPLLDVCPKRL
jgi:endonuclease III